MTTRRSDFKTLAPPPPGSPPEARVGTSVEMLRQTERQYRAMFENAIHGIYQSVPAGHFINVNPALAHMLGYDSAADMLAGCTDIARDYFVSPEDRNKFLTQIDAHGLLQGYEVQVRRKDGTAIWTRENVHAVRDERGQLLYYEGSVEDITAQKQAEAALRESEERYRNLFEYANDVILMAITPRSIRSANR
jgi:PAS domain S-box-containing protein